jgi:hypothetical protein
MGFLIKRFIMKVIKVIESITLINDIRENISGINPKNFISLYNSKKENP